MELIESLKGEKAAQNDLNEQILKDAAKKLEAIAGKDAGPDEPKN
jgi:hypothetical protein